MDHMSTGENRTGYPSEIRPDPSKQGYPFEPGLFGLNIEITRKGFYGGLSAQMLNNRKLYAGQEGVDGWICEKTDRILDRQWESPCESNFVILRDGGRMYQTSEVISVQSGRAYEAKLWVRAVSQTASVTFGLRGMEQTVELSAGEAAYQVLAFTFLGQEDAENGTFEIRTAGEVAIFEMSLLPTDHFHGMRRDVVEQLRALAPSSLRYPGGCAADQVDWKESLKAPEFRKPADGNCKASFVFQDTCMQDPLDIGLNEFLMLCREIGAEPEYTVSLNLSDAEDARKLVEYCNGDRTTEYGMIRQSLGYDAFGIRMWYVGNEVYCWGGEYENSAAAAARTDALIEAMKKTDPAISVAICLTASGAFQAWSLDFLSRLKSTFEYVSYHDYICAMIGDARLNDGRYVCAFLEKLFADGENEGLNFYKEKLFPDCFDNIRVCVDEWNFWWGRGASNTSFFSNALQFHFMAKNRERYHIDRAEFFMPVNEGMIAVQGRGCTLESSGHMFRLLGGHKGGRVIPCTSDNAALDLLCTDHGDYLYVSAVNRSAEPIALTAKDFDIFCCTELQVRAFSMDSNDWSLRSGNEAAVSGHSMSFMRMKKRNSMK